MRAPVRADPAAASQPACPPPIMQTVQARWERGGGGLNFQQRCGMTEMEHNVSVSDDRNSRNESADRRSLPTTEREHYMHE